MEGIAELFDLRGKTAVITGGASGLGLGMARALGNAGAAVVLADINGSAAQREADGLRGLGIPALAVDVDVANAAQVDDMVREAVRAFGKIDILVCAAGIALNAPAIDVSEQDFDRVMAVNLKGVFLCDTAVARSMLPHRDGRIINISSMGAMVPVEGRSAYCASKAAVSHLTRAFALEWIRSGIRVNAIAPGLMLTPLTETLLGNEDIASRFVARIPEGRFGVPNDLSGAVLFLASAASSYLVGQTIVVDGGWTLP